MTNLGKITFESFLQDYFIKLREIGGIPIIKDNCEDLFDSWLEKKDTNEIMELADIFGSQKYIEGKEDILKN